MLNANLLLWKKVIDGSFTPGRNVDFLLQVKLLFFFLFLQIFEFLHQQQLRARLLSVAKLACEGIT